MKELKAKIVEALYSALPITAIVYLLALTPFVDLSKVELVTFSLGAVMLVLGIGLFSLGADLAMTPMGAQVGSGLSRQKKLGLLLSVCFVLGMLITIADPDLQPYQYMEQVFTYWIQNQALLSALARSGLSGMLVQRAVDYTRRMNRLPMLLTNMDRQLKEYGNLFAVCGIMTIIVQWHQDGFVPDAKQMAHMALRLFREPLYRPHENG